MLHRIHIDIGFEQTGEVIETPSWRHKAGGHSYGSKQERKRHRSANTTSTPYCDHHKLSEQTDRPSRYSTPTHNMPHRRVSNPNPATRNEELKSN